MLRNTLIFSIVILSYRSFVQSFIFTGPTITRRATFLRQTSSSWLDHSHKDDEDPAGGSRRSGIFRSDASRFVTGDELYQLRNNVLALRRDLQDARETGAVSRVRELERSILQAQQLDAEFMYQVALERMEVAAKLGDDEQTEKYRQEAALARSALPQFQLEGLWVGKYGTHGFEMINVTYVGDALVAHKVTGEKTVPKGEVSFTVNLSPKAQQHRALLEPIELGKEAAQQWGTKYLQRFPGKGQVAAEGFTNSQFVEGQLILVNQYFSFAWLPIAHQVFFGRPSPELILRLLREEITDDRAHLERCIEETRLIDDELEVNDGIFHSHRQEDYYCQEGCFE